MKNADPLIETLIIRKVYRIVSIKSVQKSNAKIARYPL